MKSCSTCTATTKARATFISTRLFLPEMYDLASALGSTAILSWDSTADAAFEEACAHPVLQSARGTERKARAVTTVEFRGLNDVDIETGRADAEGLYRFLVHRGVIVDQTSS